MKIFPIFISATTTPGSVPTHATASSRSRTAWIDGRPSSGPRCCCRHTSRRRPARTATWSACVVGLAADAGWIVTLVDGGGRGCGPPQQHQVRTDRCGDASSTRGTQQIEWVESGTTEKVSAYKWVPVFLGPLNRGSVSIQMSTRFLIGSWYYGKNIWN